MKNNGYFSTLWNYIWLKLIKNSFVYTLLCRIYSFFSNRWQDSFLANLFRKEYFSAESVSKSIVGKIFFSPFSLVELVNKTYGEKLTFQQERSFLVRTCKYYLHNILALNLRFFGVLATSTCLVSLVLSLANHTGIKLELIGIILGIILMPFDINLTEYFKSSALVKLFEKLIGAELNFDFFYVTKCGGLKSILCAIFFGTVAGLLAGILSPLYAALFLGGMWFFFMVLYKVEFGVFVTVFLAPIVPTMVVAALCLLCLFSLLIRALTVKKFEFKTEGIGLTILIFLGIYLLAGLTSFAKFKSLQIWGIYFAFISFYFVIINTIKTKSQLMNLLTTFCLSGFLVCFYGILQYVFDWNISQAWMDEEMFEDIKMRIYSTLENPNVLGEYILLVLPVAISLMWKKPGILSKLTYGGISAVMGIALILTFSRGCWIGIMASASVFITFAAGKLWGLALLVLPIIPMILPDSIINRFTSIGDMKDSSTSYRVYIWMGTFLLLKDFWLTGIGPGTENFTQVYPFYSYSSVVAPHSHNLFLQVLAETGILGLAAFLLVILFYIKNLAKAHQVQGKFGDISVIMVGLGSAVTGFLVQGMFDNCFYNYRVFMIFWAVIALGTAAQSIAKKDKQPPEVTNIA